jgi:hypothetical protein
MNTDERRCSDLLTGRVLGAVFEVSNTLGAGFLENVGEYFADILVEDVLVIELKCVDRFAKSPANFTISPASQPEDRSEWRVERECRIKPNSSRRGYESYPCLEPVKPAKPILRCYCAALMVKFTETGGAGAYCAFPAWFA